MNSRLKEALIALTTALYLFFIIGWINAECTKPYCTTPGIYVNWPCVAWKVVFFILVPFLVVLLALWTPQEGDER